MKQPWQLTRATKHPRRFGAGIGRGILLSRPMTFREDSGGLTNPGLSVSLCPMQMTIDLPDKLARQLGPERENLVDIIERGLRQRWSEASGLRREVISFLARGPRPSEIIAFKPSPSAIERVRELLRRNKEGNLAPTEVAEMDEIAELDEMVSLIKAEARLHLPDAA